MALHQESAGQIKMVFTREVLEGYYKSFRKPLSMPDTVVALFSIAQQKPDMYPYWLDPEKYLDCFYDFWFFMDLYHKKDKNNFYKLVKDMEFLSEEIWNEFIRDEIMDNLFKSNHRNLGTFLAVLLSVYLDKEEKNKFFYCNSSRYFMNLLFCRYKKYIELEKSYLILDSYYNILFPSLVKRVGHLEISEIINKYIDT